MDSGSPNSGSSTSDSSSSGSSSSGSLSESPNSGSSSVEQEVRFRGSLGHELAGTLDLPTGSAVGFALFAHCFTCGKDLFAARRISAELAAHGIAVLRFDFTGLGESHGAFGHTDFSSNLDDLSLAAQWLEENHRAPSMIMGHSLGGAAVLASAPHLPSVSAVVTIGAPAGPNHVRHLFSDQVSDIERAGSAQVSIGGRPFSISRDFLADLEANHEALDRGELRADQALLILHSPTDEIVGFDQAEEIYRRADHPKSLMAIDGANHLMTSHKDAVFVAETVAHWAERYVT